MTGVQTCALPILNAAYLYAQLEQAEQINNHRLELWNRYYSNLKDLCEIELPHVPKECKHNAHMFYVKAENLEIRTKLIKYLKESGIQSVFHYVPLHTSPAGMRFGIFNGKDNYTTKESDRLLRLPMFYNLKLEEIDFISVEIRKFYKNCI